MKYSNLSKNMFISVERISSNRLNNYFKSLENNKNVGTFLDLNIS